MCYLIYKILRMNTLVYFLQNSIDNCKKLSFRQSVKVRPTKQQRSFCYVTRSCAFSVL